MILLILKLLVGDGTIYLVFSDDCSHYIVHWELCFNMKVDDVTRSIDHALDKPGLSKINAPKLLRDHGFCFISSELADYIQVNGMSHVRGRANTNID